MAMSASGGYDEVPDEPVTLGSSKRFGRKCSVVVRSKIYRRNPSFWAVVTDC